MEFMEMERQLQDNVTKRLQAILEPEDLLFDEPMKDYTTFRVGGPAKWMAAPQDEQQLRVILKICRELLKEHHSLQGVPGFYQDDFGRWTFSGKSGMLFPLMDRHGYLYRLRLRLDRPDTDENGKEKNKYKNFSSYFPTKENDRIINGFLNGCRAGSQIGFYYNSKHDNPLFCIITEGEKKAIVANYILHCIVISIPGVNNFAKLSEKDEDGITIYDYLHSIGCEKIATAFDADKLINNSVLQCESHLIADIKGAGFKAYIGKWNFGFGKGLDDILLLGILPEYVQA